MYVSLDSNKTGNDRSCLFVAYSERQDKRHIQIEQAKVHVPSGASSSGGSSSVLVVNAPHEQKGKKM